MFGLGFCRSSFLWFGANQERIGFWFGVFALEDDNR